MNRGEQFLLLRALRIPDSGSAKGGAQKAVLRCIDDHSGGTGKCWASLQTMAAETCFSRRTVIRAIASLEATGLVKVERREGCSGNYRIDWAAVANQCQPDTGDSLTPVTACHGTSDSLTPTSDSLTPKTKRNQKKPSLLRASQFEEFWKAYPPRNSRRLNKKEAASQFEKLKDSEIPDVMRAVKQYAASQQIPKDAFRWLRSSWREWLEQPVAPVAAADDDLDGLAAEDIGPRRKS